MVFYDCCLFAVLLFCCLAGEKWIAFISVSTSGKFPFHFNLLLLLQRTDRLLFGADANMRRAETDDVLWHLQLETSSQQQHICKCGNFKLCLGVFDSVWQCVTCGPAYEFEYTYNICVYEDCVRLASDDRNRFFAINRSKLHVQNVMEIN